MKKRYQRLHLAVVLRLAGITDIETGPDGFLYVLTFNGSIYRITPITDGNQ